ncbi:MAG TPA: serine hydrolase domain-containing protein [Thermoanaerobaculia bacterium]|nr:serine hydrolase domain-containing protein [Thermoanaerobaculia bacterium]
MATRTPVRNFVPIAVCFAVLCFVLLPTGAFASATLQIVQGSGEFQTLETAITVNTPVAISFRWTTDQAGATAGTWKVTDPSSVVVASGESSAASTVGHIATFSIPATGVSSFLKSTPPASPVKYTIRITPHNAANTPVGSASPAVTVTQVQAAPQKPIDFGPAANFPTIELVHYEENIGVTSQIYYGIATVQLRAVNKSSVKSDPVSVSVEDFNVLWRQNGAASGKIAALAPGEKSPVVTVKMDPVLPAPTSQTPQEQQFAKWKTQYQNICGVDLRANVQWSGTDQSKRPMNDHAQQYLYLGYGNSKSWDENHPVSTEWLCDDKQCVPINDVARSIYKQLACRVVGYAFFVGDKTSGTHGVFGAYGKARTGADPAADFKPETKMQIASTSKVLTALTGVRVFGNKMDNMAFPSFPSNWTAQNNLVKNITLRQFLSQTSGVQQYYASSAGQDFNSLKTFYMQPLPNPNAAPTCPGSGATLPIPNPIVSNKAPCYSNANFGIMRLVLPRFAGSASNDPQTLADKYVQQVRDNVFTPVGVQDVACKPPSNGNYAKLYKYPGSASGDWGDLTLVCGDWGWYVSVEDYAKVLVSLNAADHKILTDCQLRDMEINPATHPVGWDIKLDNTGRRWLEKNGADGTGNGALQTTSVGIFGGRSGCTSNGDKAPLKGVAGVLFINSDISGQPNSGASTVLLNAFQAAVKPKP